MSKRDNKRIIKRLNIEFIINFIKKHHAIIIKLIDITIATVDNHLYLSILTVIKALIYLVTRN